MLDQMEEIIKRQGQANYRTWVEKALLGAVVITRYNNRTYRIDDIAWEKHPADEFKGRNDEMTSYIKYYEERYNKKIRDPKQPLLVSMPKVSSFNPVYLLACSLFTDCFHTRSLGS